MQQFLDFENDEKSACGKFLKDIDNGLSNISWIAEFEILEWKADDTSIADSQYDPEPAHENAGNDTLHCNTNIHVQELKKVEIHHVDRGFDQVYVGCRAFRNSIIKAFKPQGFRGNLSMPSQNSILSSKQLQHLSQHACQQILELGHILPFDLLHVARSLMILSLWSVNDELLNAIAEGLVSTDIKKTGAGSPQSAFVCFVVGVLLSKLRSLRSPATRLLVKCVESLYKAHAHVVTSVLISRILKPAPRTCNEFYELKADAEVSNDTSSIASARHGFMNKRTKLQGTTTKGELEDVKGSTRTSQAVGVAQIEFVQRAVRQVDNE